MVFLCSRKQRIKKILMNFHCFKDILSFFSFKTYDSWKWSNTLLNDRWIKEKNKKEIRKYGDKRNIKKQQHQYTRTYGMEEKQQHQNSNDLLTSLKILNIQWIKLSSKIRYFKLTNVHECLFLFLFTEDLLLKIIFGFLARQ